MQMFNQLYGFTENDPEKRKHSLSSRFVGRELLLSEGQRWIFVIVTADETAVGLQQRENPEVTSCNNSKNYTIEDLRKGLTKGGIEG